MLKNAYSRKVTGIYRELKEIPGILPGIKVDMGFADIVGTFGETCTTGLDGLAVRTAEYYQMGCRFAKWRAILKISEDDCPSDRAIAETT